MMFLVRQTRLIHSCKKGLNQGCGVCYNEVGEVWEHTPFLLGDKNHFIISWFNRAVKPFFGNVP